MSSFQPLEAGLMLGKLRRDFPNIVPTTQKAYWPQDLVSLLTHSQSVAVCKI